MKSVWVPVVMILPPTLETLSNGRFIVGVGSQIPSVAARFCLSEPVLFLPFFSSKKREKNPCVYDVSTGKLSPGAEVFSDTAQTLMAEMPLMLCLLHQTDEFSTANV